MKKIRKLQGRLLLAKTWISFLLAFGLLKALDIPFPLAGPSFCSLSAGAFILWRGLLSGRLDVVPWLISEAIWLQCAIRSI